MKKTLLLALSLMLSLAANAQAVADKVIGTYNGKLYVSMEGATFNDETLVKDESETKAETYQVIITKESDTQVQFALPNFAMPGMKLGDIVLPKRGVTSDEAGKQTRFTANEAVDLTFLEGQILATAKINEANSFIANDGTALIDVDVTWIGDVRVPIYVRFEGKLDPTTGINTIATAKAGTKSFDLQGRPATPATKGIVLVGGKKIIQ